MSHWGHWRDHGHPTIKRPKICTPCGIGGCGRLAYSGKKAGRPLCQYHADLLRRHGRLHRTKPRKHDDASGGRVCTQCGEYKQNGQFRNIKPATEGGSMFSSDCRECSAAYKRRRRAEQGAVTQGARAEARRNREEKDRIRQIEVERRKHERDAAKQARRQSPTRRCTRCGEDLPKAEFWANGPCKSCELAIFKQRVDSLDEKYVRRLMAKTSTVLKGSDIPASLVQAKQMQLKIMRYLNNPRGEQ